MSKKLIVIILIMGLFISSAYPLEVYGQDTRRRIVIFNRCAKAQDQDALIRKFGEQAKRLPIINGASVLISSENEAALARRPEVLAIEGDGNVFALGARVFSTSAEVVPWGIDRIDADVVWARSKGSNAKIAVIDSGVDIDHPDLGANVKGGINVLKHGSTFDDDNGHGSHVAGIIAAVNNGIGVIGVAPGAELYAVKVLDQNGAGRISDVIEGIQWCLNNDMQVANMSLGTHTYSKALYDAVKVANSAGLIMVAAAGNNAFNPNNVMYPAKFNEVIAVSAVNEDNALMLSSCRGPEVDLCAPGEDIYSTFKGDTYLSMSGTSMASPHVAGAIALKLQLNPDLNPRQMLELLRETAKPIRGLTSEEQGAGLVDALALVNKQ